MNKKNNKVLVALLVFLVLSFGLTGCSNVKAVKANNLMEDIEPGKAVGKIADDTFVNSQMNFAVELFKSSVAERNNENVLVSPLSAQLVVAMAANGSDGETREELQSLLGGKISLEDLNEYLTWYADNLPSEEKYKLDIANSIWFNDDSDKISVEQDFLQLNADYYNAHAYKAAFNEKLVKDINVWVKDSTSGTVEKIIDTIDSETVMYLINALTFEAEWEKEYEKEDVSDGDFTSINGEVSTVKMMQSSEHSYFEDDNAVGFIKSYKDEKYRFAAILPNEGVNIYDYIEGLESEKLYDAIVNSSSDTVVAELPKFKYDTSMSLVTALKNMGAERAFDAKKADFSKLGTSSLGNIYISDVLQKCYISVDETGTKASAATMAGGAGAGVPKYITLNRPFVYMILDGRYNLPVFIGVVTNL